MILVRKCKTYRHTSCIDIDMHVMHITYVDIEYFKLKVCFVNRHNGILYEQSGTVKLYRKDLHKWSEVE